MHFVPSMLRDLSGNRWSGARCAGLRRVICSGEALSTVDAASASSIGSLSARICITSTDRRKPRWMSRSGDAGPIADFTLHHSDRQTSVEHADLYSGRASATPSPSGVPEILHIGGVQVALRLLETAGAYGGEVHRQPFRGGRAALPDWGSWPILARRDHRVSRPQRFPGEDPGLPDRARRDRGAARRASGRARGDCARAGGRARRQPAGCLLHNEAGCGRPRGRDAAGASRGEPARIHGSGGLCCARSAAAERQRQARPQRVAGAKERSLRRPRLRAAPRQDRTNPGADLGRSAPSGARRAP